LSGALTRAERLDWIRLSRTENVGPVTFRRLMEQFGSAATALDALPELAKRGGRAGLKIASAADAARELERVEKFGAGLVAWCEPDYPELLCELEDAPPLLAVKGDPALLARPCVAMVGARNASVNGRRFAEHLARDLSAAGWVVVSGLARGIDAAAHQGSLDGGTVAVVAGGIDVIYPPEHEKLQAEIGARGAVVTEAPFGTHPVARHFPRRNRIISGSSAGVIVVEAALKSGSLITARFAGEQGRDVFAVPGSPLDPRCRGTNGLIRDGAHLIENADDVLAILRPHPSRLREDRTSRYPSMQGVLPEEETLRSARREILELLDAHPVDVDELLRRCQLSRAVVLTVLLELELAGRLERHPGNRVSLLFDPTGDAPGD
jgi:DNA processing protein